jgi:hypothetical protein
MDTVVVMLRSVKMVETKIDKIEHKKNIRS